MPPNARIVPFHAHQFHPKPFLGRAVPTRPLRLARASLQSDTATARRTAKGISQNVNATVLVSSAIEPGELRRPPEWPERAFTNDA
jgi:hypothetical protein